MLASRANDDNPKQVLMYTMREYYNSSSIFAVKNLAENQFCYANMYNQLSNSINSIK